MPRLTCPQCGLSYEGATLPGYVLSPSGASCPRCATGLTETGSDDRAGRFNPASERHRVAVRRTLSWAHDAAAEGDHATALAWLATIEAVDGELPPDLEAKRQAWAAKAEQTRVHQR